MLQPYSLCWKELAMVSTKSLNLTESLLGSELRIMVLEKVVEQLLIEQAKTGRKLSIDMDAINRDSLRELREKYPDLTIKAEDDN